jgi:hypothetical protein
LAAPFTRYGAGGGGEGVGGGNVVVGVGPGVTGSFSPCSQPLAAASRTNDTIATAHVAVRADTVARTDIEHLVSADINAKQSNTSNERHRPTVPTTEIKTTNGLDTNTRVKRGQLIKYLHGGDVKRNQLLVPTFL